MAVPDPRPDLSYRGRFAPSPTGPLHAGSVVTALASFLDARSRQGQWLVRIEDLDPPRESREAVTAILHALEALGLHWDGPVLFQSQRHGAYEEAVQALHEKHLVFACDCSRQKLAAHGGIYTGRCRRRGLAWSHERALRCRVAPETIRFEDAVQGPCAQQLEAEAGDFVVRRRDGLHAYQLAVVVDDAFQGITDVVRGIDLLDSTPRQIWLQRQLGLATPRYAHVPIIVNREGHKLSKQQHAGPVDLSCPAATLVQALQYLQMAPDPALACAAPEAVLAWACAGWNIGNLKGIKQVPEIAGSNRPAV